MKRVLIIAAATLLATASSAALAKDAESWRDFPGVSNTSFAEPNGDRAVQLWIEIPAPRQQVYDAYATTDGFTSWAAPVAQVDVRVGGIIESSYNPSAKLGDRNNIRNEIVTYVPGHLIVLKNAQAPTTFVDPDLFAKTVTVVEFDAIDAGHTRVTVTNSGYGQGEKFDRLYHQFEWGNAYTLAELRNRFVKGPTDWGRVAESKLPNAASVQAEGK